MSPTVATWSTSGPTRISSCPTSRRSPRNRQGAVVGRRFWLVDRQERGGLCRPPDDPIHLLLPEEGAHETHLKRWMLRVMDVPKAIAARGFSPAVTGSAEVALQDPQDAQSSSPRRRPR